MQKGVIRAVINNISNIASSRRLEGASTITQQVAKNFLLSNEVSIDRKLKEAILAFRIERALSKERILELYLNQIYLVKVVMVLPQQVYNILINQ